MTSDKTAEMQGAAERAPRSPTNRRERRLATPETDRARLLLASPDGTVVHDTPDGVAEALRFMVARLRLKDDSHLPQVVGVGAALRGEGVTFVARSLALVLAHDFTKRVCLVDANWHAPAASPWVKHTGLADVLTRAITPQQAPCPTSQPNLNVVPAGAVAPSQHAAVANSPALDELLAFLRSEYDHVIIDLPAALVASDGLVFARYCDSVAVVVRQGVTPEHLVTEAINELGDVALAGVILNAIELHTPRWILRRLSTW